MSVQSEIAEYCITLSDLPGLFNASDVDILLKNNGVLVSEEKEEIPGHDGEKTKWVVRLKSPTDVERLVEEVKELKFPLDEQIVTVQIGRAEEKDIPRKWCISPDQKPPEISGSPKDTQKKMLPNFGVSGFYENYRPPENNPESGQPDGAGGQQNYVQPNPGQPSQGQVHDPTRGPYPPQNMGPYGGFPPHSGPFTGEDKGQGNMGQYGIITLVNPQTGEKVPGYYDPQIGQYRPLSHPGMPPFAHQQYPQGQGYPMPPQPTGPPPPYNSGGRGHMGHAPHENLRHDVVKGNEDTTKPSKAVADQDEFLEKLYQKKAKEEQHQDEKDHGPHTPPNQSFSSSRPVAGDHNLSSTTLKVYDIPPNVGADFIEMFFETQTKMKVKRAAVEGKEAIVEFVELQGAQLALQCGQLKMQGHPIYLEMMSEPLHEDIKPPLSTVQVKTEVSIDLVEMYFESKKRSGGGDIEEVKCVGDGVFHVTFTEEKVATRVVGRGGHEINGQPVEVELYNPHEEEEEEEGDEQGSTTSTPEPVRVVAVRGVQNVGDRGVLEMYFESKKRSGGGEIEKIEDDEDDIDLVYITFEDAEVAKTVTERSHTINGQDVETWLYDPRQDEEEEDVGPLCTVVVRGVQKVGSQDVLEMYFESKKRSGGGEIQEMKPDENDEDVLYITFVEEEVAETVVNRFHTINGQEVETSLYDPRQDKREEDVGPLCTVGVRGVQKVGSQDVLEMYFESKKRSGGGEIEEMKPDENDEDVLYITYVEEEAAKTVAERSHTINSQEVETWLYDPRQDQQEEEDVGPLCTIVVRGVQKVGSKDVLEMYFENEKRSGGGEIQEMRPDENDKDVLYITYAEEEVSKSVASRSPHTVNGQQLEVELFIPKPKSQTSPFSKSGKAGEAGDKKEEEEEDSEPKCMVKVKGVKNIRSIEAMLLFFENKRRSGGGEIETSYPDKENEDIYFIKFTSEEDAAGLVSNSPHTVESSTLHVSIYIPPKPLPSYSDRIIIKGVKSSTTQDCLFNFLEAKSGAVPEKMSYGIEEGVVMVTFQSNPDFAKLNSVDGKSLEGSVLRLSPVSISNCIHVADLKETTSQDTVQFYFENQRRSGGGEVDKVVINRGEDSALVYFTDFETVEKVLERKHVIDRQDVIVRRYLDCLGCPEGDGEEPPFKVPNPVTIYKVDHQKIKFFNNSDINKNALEKQMLDAHAKIIWPREKGTHNIVLECTLTSEVQQCRKLAKGWKQEAEKSFNDFFDKIMIITLNVTQATWADVMKKLDSVNIDNPDAVAVFIDKDNGAIVVAGLGPVTKKLGQDIKGFIKEVEDEVEKQKSIVKEVITTMKLIDTKMLLAAKFPTRAEDNFKNLKVKINHNKNEITFEGPNSEVRDAKVFMYEMKDSFATVTMDDIPKVSVQLYNVKQVKEHIVKKLKQSHCTAVWEVNEGKMIVCSTSEEKLNLCAELIRDSVTETSIGLQKEAQCLVESEDWQKKLEEWHGMYSGKVKIAVVNSKVVISGTDDVALDAVNAVKQYISKNTIIEQSVTFSTSIVKLINRHHRSEVDKIASDLLNFHVQITSTEGSNQFLVKGTKNGLEQAVTELNRLKNRVKKREEILKQPGVGEHMYSQKGKDAMRKTEGDHKVVVHFKGEEEGFYSPTGSSASAPRDSAVAVHASCKAYDGRMIYAGEGDMTELMVDVLVNTADEKISLTGGLGKVIVNKGGKGIQQDCKDYINQNGKLGEGEAFMCDGGNLKAKHIIHIVGPRWKGGSAKEDEVLTECVFKAMDKASQKNCKSVAIPAISCGVYGYPVKQATMIIAQAVKDFFREMQDSTVEEVYLCDIKADTVERFVTALESTFGSRNVNKFDVKAAPSGGDYDSDSEDRRSYQPMKKKKPGAVKVLPSMPQAGKGPESVKVGNITVKVVKGEIAKQSVDVIVNTTAKNLDLKNGAVSQSLSRAAGPALQQEVKQNYPKGVQDGEIAVTQGYNLRCQLVIHGALANWDGGSQSTPELHTLMSKSLKVAQDKGMSSIAFPAIGTGNLGFPRDIVAKEMFQAVTNISGSSSSVQEVRFIVYQKDLETIKAFDRETASQAFGGARRRNERQFDSPYQNMDFSSGKYDDDDDSDDDDGGHSYTLAGDHSW